MKSQIRQQPLGNIQKINKRRGMFIPESRVHVIFFYKNDPLATKTQKLNFSIIRNEKINKQLFFLNTNKKPFLLQFSNSNLHQERLRFFFNLSGLEVSTGIFFFVCLL